MDTIVWWERDGSPGGVWRESTRLEFAREHDGRDDARSGRRDDRPGDELGVLLRLDAERRRREGHHRPHDHDALYREVRRLSGMDDAR